MGQRLNTLIKDMLLYHLSKTYPKCVSFIAKPLEANNIKLFSLSLRSLGIAPTLGAKKISQRTYYKNG